jgi:hypothetical protein
MYKRNFFENKIIFPSGFVMGWDEGQIPWDFSHEKGRFFFDEM